VNNALINANERVCAQLRHSSHTLRTPENLRQIFILLENPLLVHPETHKGVLGPLLVTTTSLPVSSAVVLTEWIDRMDSEQFRRLLGIVQQFITLYILMVVPISLNGDQFLVAATKLLAVLHGINEKKKFVAYGEFYNELINDKIDLKEDFINWKNKDGFTFCNFPFILDPGIKSRILHIESHLLMRQQRDVRKVKSVFE
jgi:hypothetical protein